MKIQIVRYVIKECYMGNWSNFSDSMIDLEFAKSELIRAREAWPRNTYDIFEVVTIETQLNF